MRTAALTSVLVVIMLSLTACSSNSSSRRTAVRPPQDSKTPMGLGYPDPQALTDQALAAASAGDVHEWIACFAFVDENGKFFAGDARRMPGKIVPGIGEMKAWAAAIRTVASPAFVTQIYGKPQNIRNTPPSIEVSVSRIYRLDSPTDQQRAQILASINTMLPRRNPITWEQLKRRLLNAPRSHQQRFVFLDGRWRIDASWRS